MLSSLRHERPNSHLGAQIFRQVAGRGWREGLAWLSCVPVPGPGARASPLCAASGELALHKRPALSSSRSPPALVIPGVRSVPFQSWDKQRQRERPGKHQLVGCHALKRFLNINCTSWTKTQEKVLDAVRGCIGTGCGRHGGLTNGSEPQGLQTAKT